MEKRSSKTSDTICKSICSVVSTITLVWRAGKYVRMFFLGLYLWSSVPRSRPRKNICAYFRAKCRLFHLYFLIRNTTDMQTKPNKMNEPIPNCHIKSLFFFWYVTYFGSPHFLWNHISCGSDLISLLKLFWRPDCLFVNDITDITSFWRTDKYLLRKMKFLLIISPMWVRTHDVPDTCRVL